MDAVDPPKGLPKDAIDDWNTVTADLSSRKLLTDSTLGVVAMYCTALWIVRECVKSIEKDGLFVLGQNKVPKSNPASIQMQKAQETVTRLSVELGLTPSSRSRRGLGGPAVNPDDEAGDIGI